MKECRICGKVCTDLKHSLVNHIVKYHNIPIYDYYIQFDIDDIKCSICGKNKPKEKIHQPLCNNKYCRIFSTIKRKYDNSKDYFGLFNPDVWLDFYNKNTEKTVKKLKYLSHFKSYLQTKFSSFLPNIFSKMTIDQGEIIKFVDRIKKEEIDVSIFKSLIPSNSKKRWILFGFSEEVSERISIFFRTSFEAFSKRGNQEIFYIWKDKAKRNRTPQTRQTMYSTKEYWLQRGLTEEQAVQKTKQINSRSLNYFIEKYGVDDGTCKYQNMIDKRKFAFSLDGFIKKYGKEEGIKKYEEVKFKKVSWSFIDNKHVSKIATNYFDQLELKLRQKNIIFTKIQREYVISYFLVDFYIFDKKIAIEFYGDYWHYNPLFYTNQEKYYTKVHTAQTNRLLTLFNSDYIKNVLVVWESFYIKSPEVCLTESVNFIENLSSNYLELNYDGKNILRKYNI